MRHVVHKYDWLDFFQMLLFSISTATCAGVLETEIAQRCTSALEGERREWHVTELPDESSKKRRAGWGLAWWYGFGDEKCTEGWTERTHPVQPGTFSYEARWGPCRASAALPGLQAPRAHIWNNISLCIIINHDIFQKKAKTCFIGRTLAPLH